MKEISMENASRIETMKDEIGNDVFWSYEIDGHFYIEDMGGNPQETDHFVDPDDVTYSDTDGWMENGKAIKEL